MGERHIIKQEVPNIAWLSQPINELMNAAAQIDLEWPQLRRVD